MFQSILLIVDEPDTAETVRLALEGTGPVLLKPSDGTSYRVEWVRRCADALARIDNDTPMEHGNEAGGTIRRNANIVEPRSTSEAQGLAAILVDLNLPDCRGIEVFKQLFRAAPHVPILVLSSAANEDLAKSALLLGAQDYLLKSRIDSYSLPKAVRSMTDRAAIVGALFEEKELAQITLNSIGDAVITTDLEGRVKYLNAVAERMTGWTLADAAGQPIGEVLDLVDGVTRETVPNPMISAVRENRTIRLTPNCVLVRRNGGEVAIEDSAAPIHSYRRKPTGAVMVFHDVSIARELSLKMSYLAQHDPLTGLPNRSLLSDRLNQAVATAHRNGMKLALLFLDLDHFKGINDTRGHGVGDQIIQSVAKRLIGCVRGPDTVSRQGGDEFVVMLPELAQARDAAMIAEKIMIALAKPHTIDRQEFHVTVSIGIATYPEDGSDTDELMRHADFAMYHAKETGRNNYQFFKTSMTADAVERRAIESGLRRAVERSELTLHYQPQVDLESGFIVGVEALLRWHREDREAVPTALFVRVAEDCGLIVPIGRWVLTEACRQARAWLDAGLPLVRISVNVSEVEIRARDFVAAVREVLTETGLPASFLELELTETFLVRDLAATAQVFGALKTIGVRLALDDFGTGYSSLSHLRGLPIDTLKIDQSFVRELMTDVGVARIVSAVIRLGESLGMNVVAEGVETTEQQAFLLNHGCLVGQGYLFGRPMHAVAITTMLALQAADAGGRGTTPLVLRASP